MKKFSLFLLIIIILLTACAPQSLVTTAPTVGFTNIPPQTTQTFEPTSTLIPMGNIVLDSCTQIIEAKISNAGILQVVYGGGVPRQSVISKFGMAEYTGLWMWSKDTQAADPFPLPQDALDPKLSADHHWIVFRRDLAATQSEL